MIYYMWSVLMSCCFPLPMNSCTVNGCSDFTSQPLLGPFFAVQLLRHTTYLAIGYLSAPTCEIIKDIEALLAVLCM